MAGVIISLLAGLSAGSTMACFGMRMADHVSWIKGRSCCEKCGHALTVFDLIPVLSYLFLKGRCRYCGEKISFLNPAAEISAGVFFVLLFLKEGRIDLDVLYAWMAAGVLLGMSVCDVLCYRIPDVFVMMLLGLRCLYCFLKAENEMHFMMTLWQDITGGVVLAGMVLFTGWIMSRLHHEQMIGGGDIKLLFALGGMCGLQKGAVVLVIACLCGLLFVLLLKRRKIPFGPCLAAGAWIVLLIKR